jgi:Ca-activated chloride channel family protein
MAYIAYQLQSNFKYVLLKFILRTIYFALLMAGMLAPSFGDVKKEISISEKEMYFLVDISRSMSVRDVQPNRLLKAKSTLKTIIQNLNNDKIGLIIFSKEAFIQCPLTTDKEALNLFIETINDNILDDKGTDFAPAIHLAVNKLSQTEQKENIAKFIILISDGEDFSNTTENELELAAKKQISIYTLGIGTDKGEKIPYNKGYAIDEDGNYEISKLQKKQLKNIARTSNGKYYEINENINESNRLIRDIDQLKGIKTDSKIIDVAADKYFYLIFIALILIIFDVIITFKTIKI